MIPLDPFKYNNINQLNKDYDRALRNVFRNEIKGNFLIKIYHNVLDKISHELNKYYPINCSLESSIVGCADMFQYDICKMIVGLHKSNMIFVPETERIKKQDSIEYQNQLINEVLENIKLRHYGSSFFRQHQIIYGDRFLYFHLPYDLFVICIRMNQLLVDNQDKKIPFYHHISKIANIGLSALSLLEDNFLDNAYPLCRMILELYIEMMILLKCPKAQDCYGEFSQIEFRKTQSGIDYPKEFLDQYEKRTNQFENRMNMYLHFGWVDKIKGYHNIAKKNPYSIAGIIEYLKQTDKDEDYSIYERFYKMCHSYSHANMMGIKYQILPYFEISIMLYMAILNTYLILCNLLDMDSSIDGIDIKNKTIKDYELLVNQYNQRSTENFENYYKQTKF